MWLVILGQLALRVRQAGIQEEQIAGHGQRRVGHGFQLRGLQLTQPGGGIVVSRHGLGRDLRRVQAVGQEGRLPRAVGVAVPLSVTGEAALRPVGAQAQVLRALGIAQLQLGGKKQIVAPAAAEPGPYVHAHVGAAALGHLVCRQLHGVETFGGVTVLLQLQLAADQPAVFIIAVRLMDMGRQLRQGTFQRAHGLVAILVMGVGALALLHAAAELLGPLIAVVRMGVGAFALLHAAAQLADPGPALVRMLMLLALVGAEQLAPDQLEAIFVMNVAFRFLQAAAESAAHGGTARFGVNVALRFLQPAGQQAPLGIAIVGMGMGPQLRQGADQISGLVVTVVVMGMQHEIGLATQERAALIIAIGGVDVGLTGAAQHRFRIRLRLAGEGEHFRRGQRDDNSQQEEGRQPAATVLFLSQQPAYLCDDKAMHSVVSLLSERMKSITGIEKDKAKNR